MVNHPERKPHKELTPDLLSAYAGVFIHRHDCYPLQLKTGAYASIKKPFHLELVRDHILGKITLGAYALDEQSVARWVCVDADDNDQWAMMKFMATELAQENVRAYLETSRRGGHLWLFTPPLPGKQARQFGQQLLANYGLDPGVIEIFPKQSRLKTGVGSLVRLPLGVHQKTRRRYHFISPDGQPLAPTIREQIQLLGQPEIVSYKFIQHVLAQIPPAPELPQVEPSTPIFAEGASLSEKIKSSMSVYDFVRQHVPLDESGRGLCPFHDDQHQSFGVNIKDNYWSCYAGCGGGSVIDFWMKWRETHGQDSSFTETIKELREMLL